MYSLDTVNGKLKKLSSVKVHNPSFLTLAPGGRYLYACTETQTPGKGSLCSYAVDTDKKTLRLINRQPSNGENPVYAVVNKTAQWLIEGNYTEASVSIYPLNNDGSIKAATQVLRFCGGSIRPHQEKAHIHSTIFSPAEDHIFFPDLGADKIWSYSFLPGRAEEPLQADTFPVITLARGSGPRHMCFHPGGKYAYCISELSGFIDVYSYKEGHLQPIQHIAAHAGNPLDCSSADIHISPDGRYLYASNRGHENNIAIFTLNDATGRLKFIRCQSALGNHPRMFAISPSGKFLVVANMISGNIIVFRRDATTGFLRYTGASAKIRGASCVQIISRD